MREGKICPTAKLRGRNTLNAVCRLAVSHSEGHVLPVTQSRLQVSLSAAPQLHARMRQRVACKKRLVSVSDAATTVQTRGDLISPAANRLTEAVLRYCPKLMT